MSAPAPAGREAAFVSVPRPGGADAHLIGPGRP
jgi:hypothetical protein